MDYLEERGVCSGLPRGERVCSGLPRGERVCSGLPRGERVCSGLPRGERGLQYNTYNVMQGSKDHMVPWESEQGMTQN